ncbi:hypothetical protein O0I10_004481 [Lichtheimia ornata]|uniref:LsmAD domain-containing protein n=1 Tax=Lichtheimia ornata TaxID=688661 RepID=A0AAD7Y0J2_9FUNG|nr:uncharacterized protein O0I10_004481 [Lichtheimia ornata]KAJ8659888.1 hypothetical protein O0I10_004481 [Lichtheimia ornata]
MSLTNSRHSSARKDFGHPKQNQSRGSNKKWPNSNRGGSASGSHGHANTTSSTATAPPPPPPKTIEPLEDAETARMMHDRMLFLLANLTGSAVQVTVKNGTKFEGIFHGASTEGDLGIALKHARKIYDPAAPKTDKQKVNPYPVKPSMLIMGKDVVEISCMDTDLTAGDQEKNTFKTDTDISGKLEIKERELHRWNPEAHVSEGELLGSLEEQTSTVDGSWDQFAANEKLFGLTTDFDEELYTTRLDRSAPDYKERERWAIEKANEIQKSATSNVHVMEERGLIVDDSGMDEEDRYGAVVRDVNPNKYTPPALRKHLRTESSSKKEAATEGSKTEKAADATTALHHLKISNLPKGGTAARSPVANLPTSRPHATDKKSADGQSKHIEAEVANTFRAFAIQEKDKLHAKKQAIKKKEFDDLMQFHQTFKLKFPVPTDIVPLLSAGKKPTSPVSDDKSPTDKQESISEEEKKAEQQQAASSSSKQSSSATGEKATDKTTTTTTKSEKPSAEANKPAKSTFKFNVKATEFKPNPTAPAFVPGAKPAAGGSSPFFAGRQLKKGAAAEPLTLTEAFHPPFAKGKEPVAPNSVGPTWPFGTKQYRLQFNQYSAYEEDMYAGYGSPGYPYGYPQYRYPPQYVQGMPPMPQQGGHPYMSPQFVQNVPFTAAPVPHGAPSAVAYSPQMANVSPHGSPYMQNFSSPQRSPIPPHGAPPQPVYQYQGAGPHGAPVMMTSGPGQVMVQMPVMDYNQAPYPYPQQQQQPQPQQHPEQSQTSTPSTTNE